MIVRREANGVAVPVPPREGLDSARIIQRCAQDGAVTDPGSSIGERWEGLPSIVGIEGGVTTRHFPAARVEQVVAERDLLTRNIRLVCAAAIVETDDAAVGRRSLGPVNPAPFE